MSKVVPSYVPPTCMFGGIGQVCLKFGSIASVSLQGLSGVPQVWGGLCMQACKDCQACLKFGYDCTCKFVSKDKKWGGPIPSGPTVGHGSYGFAPISTSTSQMPLPVHSSCGVHCGGSCGLAPAAATATHFSSPTPTAPSYHPSSLPARMPMGQMGDCYGAGGFPPAPPCISPYGCTKQTCPRGSDPAEDAPRGAASQLRGTTGLPSS